MFYEIDNMYFVSTYIIVFSLGVLSAKTITKSVNKLLYNSIDMCIDTYVNYVQPSMSLLTDTLIKCINKVSYGSLYNLDKSNLYAITDDIIYVDDSYKICKIPLDKIFNTRYIDLNNENKIIIPVDTIKSYINDINTSGNINLVYIKYNYKYDSYIVPISLDNTLLKFPLYSRDTLDICLKEDMDVSLCGKYNVKELYMIMKAYAGPKGNFYNDLNFRMNVSDLIYMTEKRRKCVLDKDNSVLSIDLLLDSYKFKHGDLIEFN